MHDILLKLSYEMFWLETHATLKIVFLRIFPPYIATVW